MTIENPKSLQQLLESLFSEEENVDEMTISTFKTVGDWSKKSSFRHDVDRRLLTNPKAVQKIHKQWEKTPYEFDLYVVNDPRVNKAEFREVGPVDMAYVREKMKLTPEEIPDPPGGRITVIFTSNVGDQRYMASGWILAHRFGHALARGNNDVSREWRDFTNRLRELVVEILDQVYDITVPKRNDFGGDRSKYDKILKYVAQQLGSMKSARDANLRNWYEFAYELLAQYMLTGKIKFNPLPNKLITGLAGWGRKETRGVMWPGTQKMYNEHDLEYYASELETMLDNVLDRAVGKVFVM